MNKIHGHIAAIAVVCVWGTTFVSSKVLLGAGLMPAEIFLMRFVMAYLCLACVSHKRWLTRSVTDELTMMGLGVMGGSLYFLMENMALVYSTAANVSILVSTSPLLTALLVSLFYKSERMNGKQVLGSFVAFIGTVLVILNGQLVLHLNPKGDVLAFAAAGTWAVYSLLMKRVMGRYQTDFITRKVFGYGVLSILPYFALVHPMDVHLAQLMQPKVMFNLLFLGLIASTCAYIAWNWAMQKLGAVKATNYIYMQTIVTLIAGAVILGERITVMGLCGMVILIVGMVRALKKG